VTPPETDDRGTVASLFGDVPPQQPQPQPPPDHPRGRDDAAAHGLSALRAEAEEKARRELQKRQEDQRRREDMSAEEVELARRHRRAMLDAAERAAQAEDDRRRVEAERARLLGEAEETEAEVTRIRWRVARRDAGIVVVTAAGVCGGLAFVGWLFGRRERRKHGTGLDSENAGSAAR
jgi:hypothetical protein